MNRFDYVQYDEKACSDQKVFKDIFMRLEEKVVRKLSSQRSRALVLTKLEEAYMWVGKAIRDDQVERSAAPLQEERVDS